MKMELKNLSTYRRYIWREPNLLIIKGDIGPVMEGLKAYNARFGLENPSGESWQLLRHLLAAAGLAAVLLSERESWGWTLTLPGSSFGFFIGVEPEGMICARVKEADAMTTSVFVQRQKHGGPLVQSHYQALGGDPVRLIQRYFEEVEQTRTRLAVSEQGSGVLVHCLPGGDFDVQASVNDHKLIDLIEDLEAEGSLKRLDEVLLFYECRCDDGMILKMIESLPETKRDELWGDLNIVEVECPRCGRQYSIASPKIVN